MKIYRHIRFDWHGNVIEEDSFEYQGEIAVCKGGSNPPGISPVEAEMTETQTELLKEQIAQLRRQNELFEDVWPALEEYYKGQIDYAQLQMRFARDLLPLQAELARQGVDLNKLQIEAIKSQTETNIALEPLLLETLGYEKDEAGNYVAVEAEQDPLLAQLEERYKGALAGEGGSPYLEKELAGERGKLEEDLSRRLGPDWKTTTAGIQALSDFDTKANLLREESQRADTASAGSQYLATRGAMAGEQQQKVANILGLMGRNAGGVTPTTGGIGGGTSPGGIDLTGLMGGGASTGSAFSGLSDLRNYYQTNRYNRWSAEQGQKAGQQQAMMSGMATGATVGTYAYPGIGTAVGAGVGLLAGYLLS